MGMNCIPLLYLVVSSQVLIVMRSCIGNTGHDAFTCAIAACNKQAMYCSHLWPYKSIAQRHN